jgi:hypothetical protein
MSMSLVGSLMLCFRILKKDMHQIDSKKKNVGVILGRGAVEGGGINISAG